MSRGTLSQKYLKIIFGGLTHMQDWYINWMDQTRKWFHFDFILQIYKEEDQSFLHMTHLFFYTAHMKVPIE